jgi:hypothetical protein
MAKVATRHPRWGAALAAGSATLALVASSCGTGPSTGASSSTTSTTRAVSVQASLAPWRLGAPVSRPVVLSDGSALVVMGGLDASDSSVSGVFRVDPASGATTRLGQLVRPTHDAGGAVLAGSMFVFGGGSTSVYSSVQQFTPGGPARLAASLPDPRADLAVTTLGTQAFLVGGYDGSVLLHDVLATTDGTDFKVVSRLAQPVRYPAVAGADGAVYVFGGEQSGGESSGSPTTAIQKVDPATGATQVIGQLPAPLGHAVAAAIGGRIVVMGGRGASGAPVDTVYVFDPATGALSAGPALPQPVADVGMAVIGDTVYLVGGEGPSTLSTVVEVRVT